MDAEAPVRLFRLLYCSRMTPAVAADLEPTLKSVLEASIRNNREASISGLLIGHRGWFVQALEGPERALEQRFDVIRRDPRHTDCSVLHWGHVAERAFPRWSMCAQGLSATDEAILTTLEYKAEFDPSRWNEAVVMRLLGAVSKIHERSLAQRYEVAQRTAEAMNSAA
jgi:hypothetical protein